ncbi:MAG: cytochrome c3 family protein [Planctomycetota bacterium]
MRSRTQFLIAVSSGLIVALVAVSDLGQPSPGPLASVHGREADLSGKNDCSECHGGIFGSLQSSCLECHEPIAAQLADLTGLHGTLEARAEQCGLCHAEHHGAGAPLVHGQSFALAGVSNWEKFDHAKVGVVLDGAHAPLDCKECHEHARTPILPPGGQRFLGLDIDCASCHEDPHEGQRALACADCHGQETWDGLRSLGHDRVLPLIGGHALACSECHGEESGHGLDVLGGKGQKPEARDCKACHESPHTPEFEQGNATLAALAAGQACVTCHAPEHETFHELALLEMTPAQHAKSGFTLDAPHDVQACTDCHAVEARRFEGRYPGRTQEACSACHEDVHAGQFETGPFAGQECTACHSKLHFEPHEFTPEKHARGALELTGQHLELECGECHTQPDEEEPRRFRGTESDCDACHEDAHDGFFEPRLAGLLPSAHGDCERCHDAERFANAEHGFEHGRFTGFEIAGAHAEAECAACHEARAEPDARGRVFGTVREHFGEFEGCVTCHADPHSGFFDLDNGFPARVEGRADCARCHVESSFRTQLRAFDHGYWTGFVLSGAHAEAQCTACHTPLPGRGPNGRTTAEAPGNACSDCHEDPHAGQFASEAGTIDCARCHASQAEEFLVFDHETDSRFALGEAHAALACSDCHQDEPRGGLLVTHFRPLGIECVDCHGTNAEVLLRRQPRRR